MTIQTLGKHNNQNVQTFSMVFRDTRDKWEVGYLPNRDLTPLLCDSPIQGGSLKACFVINVITFVYVL